MRGNSLFMALFPFKIIVGAPSYQTRCTRNEQRAWHLTPANHITTTTPATTLHANGPTVGNAYTMTTTQTKLVGTEAELLDPRDQVARCKKSQSAVCLL